MVLALRPMDGERRHHNLWLQTQRPRFSGPCGRLGLRARDWGRAPGQARHTLIRGHLDGMTTKKEHPLSSIRLPDARAGTNGFQLRPLTGWAARL